MGSFGREVRRDMDMLGTILIAAGLPSAITSFGIGWLNRKLTRRQEEEERKEEARRKNEAIVIEGVMASITLGKPPQRQCSVFRMHIAMGTCTQH